MSEKQHVVLDLAVGKVAQPVQPLIANDVDRPAHDRSGILVEPFEDLGIGAGSIVVADKSRPGPMGDRVEAALRVAAIADDIAKTQRLVHLWAVPQHRLQGVPVGVNVGNDRDLQAGLS